MHTRECKRNVHALEEGSGCYIDYCIFTAKTLFQPRVVTLVADKLDMVVRRRGSETNCIRELEDDGPDYLQPVV